VPSHKRDRGVRAGEGAHPPGVAEKFLSIADGVQFEDELMLSGYAIVGVAKLVTESGGVGTVNRWIFALQVLE
jgi:hypothetical protein